MKMTLVEAFVYNPCTGWGPYKWDDIGTKCYGNIEELLEDFADHGEYKGNRYKILRSWSKRTFGFAFVYELNMKTEYQLKHPDYNQAEYHATLVITED